MSKRWTLRDDLHLAKYFVCAGDRNCSRDLGRPEGSAERRVKKLKATGAWTELAGMIEADFEFRYAYHIAMGQMQQAAMLAMTHPGAPDEEIEEFGNATPAHSEHGTVQ